MNVYDTANRLASEIRNSDEYKNYKKAKDEITSNPETKSKVNDFEKLRYEVQLLDYQGKGESEDKNKKLQDMYAMLVQDKKIKEYFDLEVKFNIMIADVNKRLEDREISIALTPQAEQYIIEHGYDPVYGARPLKRYLQKHVETAAARLILNGNINPGDVIKIDLIDGSLDAYV